MFHPSVFSSFHSDEKSLNFHRVPTVGLAWETPASRVPYPDRPLPRSVWIFWGDALTSRAVRLSDGRLPTFRTGPSWPNPKSRPQIGLLIRILKIRESISIPLRTLPTKSSPSLPYVVGRYLFQQCFIMILPPFSFFVETLAYLLLPWKHPAAQLIPMRRTGPAPLRSQPRFNFASWVQMPPV